jgi:hypothetical protein
VTRRRKRTGPARCNTCQAPIVWLKLRDKWRSFEPKPVVPGSTHGIGNPSYPVEGKIAWPLEDLVAELMVRRECSDTAARAEAYDFDWRTVHHCPDDYDHRAAELARLEEGRHL